MNRLLLKKIVSGGQTGADQAGLRAAKRLGLETGGWAPRGWTTLDGPAPWLAEFGLREMKSPFYPTRTRANVSGSDATVRFAKNFFSPGERCTMRAITEIRAPYMDIGVPFLGVLVKDECTETTMRMLLKFLVEERVVVLNVAGNSEKTAPGIGAFVEEFLVASLAPYLNGGNL